MPAKRAAGFRAAIALLAACIAANGALGAVETDFPSFSSEGEPSEIADAIVGRMRDEEILGQLFMISYAGVRPDEAAMKWVRERGAGGVKIFGWNAQDERALVESIAVLQRASLGTRFGVPLLVATDQEGGWIRHVGGRTSRTPGNMALGASGFPQDAYDSGLIIGAELASLGINMNFAPVVDVATNADSWVIGARSFSSDPMEVAVLAAAYARGLADSGIIATAKHFPGHGGTSLDSHVSLPSINVDWKTLWSRELLPYRVLAKDGVPAVMSGHLSFPALGWGDEPASMSRKFLKDALRDRIGFKGVIVTDDLRMEGAIAAAGSLSRAVVKTIAAGNDIVLMSAIPPEECWRTALSAMRSDPAFRARCVESARRVLALKLSRLRGEKAPPLSPDYDSLTGRLPDPRASAHALAVSARAITAIKAGVLPLRAKGGSCLVASPYAAFIAEGERAYPGASSYRFGGNKDARAAEAKELARRAKGKEWVFLTVSNDGSAAFMAALRGSGAKIAVVAVSTPAALGDYSPADTVLACYSVSKEAFTAAFSALRGDIPARGRLPIGMP